MRWHIRALKVYTENLWVLQLSIIINALHVRINCAKWTREMLENLRLFFSWLQKALSG